MIFIVFVLVLSFPYQVRATSETLKICQGSDGIVRCQTSQRIIITSASYGRRNRMCTFSSFFCRPTMNITEQVQSFCNCKDQCYFSTASFPSWCRIGRALAEINFECIDVIELIEECGITFFRPIPAPTATLMQSTTTSSSSKTTTKPSFTITPSANMRSSTTSYRSAITSPTIMGSISPSSINSTSSNNPQNVWIPIVIVITVSIFMSIFATFICRYRNAILIKLARKLEDNSATSGTNDESRPHVNISPLPVDCTRQSEENASQITENNHTKMVDNVLYRSNDELTLPDTNDNMELTYNEIYERQERANQSNTEENHNIYSVIDEDPSSKANMVENTLYSSCS